MTSPMFDERDTDEAPLPPVPDPWQASHLHDPSISPGRFDGRCTECRRAVLGSEWTIEFRTTSPAGVPLTEARWCSQWQPVENHLKPTDAGAPRIDVTDA